MTQLRKRKLLLLAVLVIMTAFFAIKSPYYLKFSNWITIFREASTTGILAIGMAYVIISGGIDLSVGSVFSICGMLYLKLFHAQAMPAVLIILTVLLAAVCIGAANGLFVTRLGIPDFIATLATMTVFRGLTTIIAPRDGNGNVASINISDDTFSALAGKVGPIHLVILAFFILCLVGHLVLRYTRIGTSIYATGSNPKSALLSGINVKRAKLFAYCFSGLMAGIAATFYTARIRSATTDLGTGIETDVIAAVVVGGTLFSGGEGDILGVALGAVFLEVLQNGLYKLNVSSAFDPIIIGGVIIVSIMLDSLLARFTGGKRRRQLDKGKGAKQHAR